MMDVNVDVQDPGMILEQLQDGHHDVINIAKATGLKLFCMVQSTAPVDGNVGSFSVELLCSLTINQDKFLFKYNI